MKEREKQSEILWIKWPGVSCHPDRRNCLVFHPAAYLPFSDWRRFRARRGAMSFSENMGLFFEHCQDSRLPQSAHVSTIAHKDVIDELSGRAEITYF